MERTAAVGVNEGQDVIGECLRSEVETMPTHCHGLLSPRQTWSAAVALCGVEPSTTVTADGRRSAIRRHNMAGVAARRAALGQRDASAAPSAF